MDEGKIRAYDHYIDGENIEIIPDRLIVQKWRGSDWPEGHYSTARFELREMKDGKTRLTFTQTGVPEQAFQDIKQGWIEHYWEKMKAAYGW